MCEMRCLVGVRNSGSRPHRWMGRGGGLSGAEDVVECVSLTWWYEEKSMCGVLGFVSAVGAG